MYGVAAQPPQTVLAEVGEEEVVGARRGLGGAALADLALYLLLRGDPVPAVAVNARVGRLPRRLRREVFGHVGLGPARLAGVEERRGLVAHERGRFDGGVRLGDRELHALVRADRPAEDDPLARVGHRLVDEPPAVPDRLRP